jgi:hypothetical protein
LAAGVKLSDKVMAQEDIYVSDSAIKKAIAQQLSKDPNLISLSWRESIGIVELGPGIGVSLPVENPVGVGVSLNFGLQVNGLFAYRYASPKPVFRTPQAKTKTIIFPTSVEQALLMPLGAEAELRGRGRLQVYEGLCVDAGAGVSNFVRAGLALSLTATQSIAGEYSVSVMNIGAQKVRITITKLNEIGAQLGVNLRLGILNILGPTAADNDNAFKKFLINATQSQLESLARDYASILASFTAETGVKDTILCCYDLDLSNSYAQKAFVQLISLRPVDAQKLVAQSDNSIELVRWEEKEKQAGHKSQIQVFNRQILLYELSRIEHDGLVIDNANSKIYYCDKIYSEKFNNIFTGNREICWEGIEITNNNNKPENYYRFFYTQTANIPKQEEVDKYFAMADRLAIRTSGATQQKLIEMSAIKMLGSHSDDTTATMEIYFTQSGITTLQNADAALGVLAYLAANNYTPHAINILERYYNLDQQWFSFCTSRTERNEIKNYYIENYKSDFDTDYASFIKAKRFGTLVQEFHDAQNRDHVRNFFAILGGSQFDYQEILLSLAALMGREHVLVHKLSMTGGLITLESVDEGEITHPRQKAKNLFNRINTSM